MKIVADSSANLWKFSGVPYANVPLVIQVGEQCYTDNATLDVDEFITTLAGYKGKTGTACPGVGTWIEAFGGEKEVFAVTITSNLSGSYNSARVAAEQYMEENPGYKVYIVDSLSTGPEPELIVEKLRDLILEGLSFEEICEQIAAYQKKTGLIFMLGSLDNLARNGRVSHAVARLTGMLNIRIVGRASEIGDLEPLSKGKGDKMCIKQIWKHMKSEGYAGGKVRLTHTWNPDGALLLREMIEKEYPDVDIAVRHNTGLCSYYAERCGVLAGFEKG